MTALADYFDLDGRDSCEETSVADTDITLVEIREVVEPVDFIDAFKAAFFDHGQCSTWTFFGWLKQESDCFTGGYLDCML